MTEDKGISIVKSLAAGYRIAPTHGRAVSTPAEVREEPVCIFARSEHFWF